MSNLIKYSLVAVLSLGLMPSTSFAQEAGEDDVEEVIVTGSKIKKSVFDSSKPLEIISDAAIERTGLNNIGDILQSISSNDGNGIRPVTTATNGGDGSNEISLRNLGAELKLVPAKPYKDDNNFVKIAARLAEELKPTNNNGVIWANQFDNTANAKGHYEGTGKEIWEQTEGKVDGVVCSSGTGGTISGVSNALKEKNKDIKIYLSDPKGSALYSYIKNGELKSEGNSITEGIGSSRITKNFENAKIDGAYSIDDHEALPILYDLIQNEGLSLGTSCGINIAGAIKLGKELGPGKTIVTILCDKSDKYNSKMFNKSFLKEKNLPIPSWL